MTEKLKILNECNRQGFNYRFKKFRKLFKFFFFFVGHKIDFYKLWKTKNIRRFILFK